MTRSKCKVAIALFSAIACVTTNSFAQEKAETSPPPSNQQSVANLITQSVVKLGVFSCAERVEQVTSYLGFGPDTVVTIRTPKQPANKRSLSIAMDIPSVADNAMAFADFRNSMTHTLPNPNGLRVFLKDNGSICAVTKSETLE